MLRRVITFPVGHPIIGNVAQSGPRSSAGVRVNVSYARLWAHRRAFPPPVSLSGIPFSRLETGNILEMGFMLPDSSKIDTGGERRSSNLR